MYTRIYLASPHVSIYFNLKSIISKRNKIPEYQVFWFLLAKITNLIHGKQKYGWG